MANLFFVGDSITAGAWDAGGGWTARLIADVMSLNLTAQAQRLNFYCLPYNLGVSGDSVPGVAARLEREIAARSESEPRERVEIVIAIGVNDALRQTMDGTPQYSATAFKTNLDELLILADRLAARVAVIGLLPVVDALLPTLADKSASRRVQQFETIIASACTERRVRFQPLFATWQELPNWERYLPDGTHPNTEGHALLAAQIRSFILNDEFLRYHSW